MTMPPDLAVLSAGYAPEHDFRWKTETEDRHDLAPELRKRFEWLDDEHPAILIERHATAGDCRVLLAGLATDRSDYRNRVIRNAILWQHLAPDAARALAIRFLREPERLIAACNAAITSQGNAAGGFSVNWQALRALTASAEPFPPGRVQADGRCWEKPLAEKAATLAEIEDGGWPAKPSLLLVATRLPSSSALRELREQPAWRLHHEQATNQELPPKAPPRPAPGIPPEPATPNSSEDLKALWVGLAIALVLIWIVWPKKGRAPADSGGQLPAPSPAVSSPHGVLMPTPATTPSSGPASSIPPAPAASPSPVPVTPPSPLPKPPG